MCPSKDSLISLTCDRPREVLEAKMIRLSLANWSNLLGKRGNWEFGYFRVLGELGISGFTMNLGEIIRHVWFV